MKTALSTIIVALLILGTSVHAVEPGTVALGVDFSATFIGGRGSCGSSYLTLQVPSMLRIHPFIGRNIAADIRVASIFAAGSGESASNSSLMLGISPHFGQPESRLLTFVTGLVSLDLVTGDGSASQFGFGGALGIQGYGSTFNPRLELMIIRKPETGEFCPSTTVQVNVGISFFTK